jgi:hypothetical protein
MFQGLSIKRVLLTSWSGFFLVMLAVIAVS